MRVLFATLIGFAATSAGAECRAPSQTFLSCTLSNGAKTLDVCFDAASLTYRFGKTGAQPDLTLFVPASAAPSGRP